MQLRRIPLDEFLFFLPLVNDDWLHSVASSQIFKKYFLVVPTPSTPAVSVSTCVFELALHTFYKKIKIQKNFKIYLKKNKKSFCNESVKLERTSNDGTVTYETGVKFRGFSKSQVTLHLFLALRRWDSFNQGVRSVLIQSILRSSCLGSQFYVTLVAEKFIFYPFNFVGNRIFG